MKKEGNSCSIREMTVGRGEDNDKRMQEVVTLKRGNHRRW